MLTRITLDRISTAIGILAFVIGTLTAYDFIDRRAGGAIAACCIGINGFLTNKPPKYPDLPPVAGKPS